MLVERQSCGVLSIHAVQEMNLDRHSLHSQGTIGYVHRMVDIIRPILRVDTPRLIHSHFFSTEMFPSEQRHVFQRLLRLRLEHL